MTTTAPLLEVDGLSVRFHAEGTVLRAVNAIDFNVMPGETLGIVGESGSGKTQILMALMGLLAANGQAEGRVRLNGRDILNAPSQQLDEIRGSAMSMIFQDPMTALNPYLKVGSQLSEVLIKHRGATKAEAADRAVAMLELVGIPEARRRLQQYPHEFSGGMRQRVMIAMALLCEPSLLLADEPTTALDVTVQAQVLELLADVSRRLHTAVILVTHDMGVVAGLCDRVIVLYGGRIMETAPVGQLFADPRHPYTAGLLRSMPRMDEPPLAMLATIDGQPPSPLSVPPGCPFEPRCTLRIGRCASEMPGLQHRAARSVACFRATL